MVFGTHTGHYSMSSFTTDPLTLRMTRMQLNREGTSSYDERTDLTYDPAGNITQAKATLAGGTVDNQCFGYDYQQQLTEAWTPNTGVCDPNARSQAGLGGPAPYWSSWSTDTIGKTTKRVDRTPSAASTTTYSYQADGDGAVRPHFVTGTATTGSNPGSASYGADAAGNTTTRPAAGGGTQTLTWDELNQLTDVAKDGVTVASMIYDAAGTRLLRKQGDTTTLFLGGNEISLNTSTNVVSANRYYSHAGQTVAVRTGASNDTVSTLISDWQGTTHHQVVNATGALSTTWQDPYGATRGTPPTAWTGERGFVGGTKDATGLTRIGARDYDPALQRFITVDPVQDLADPLQWNPYIYSNNTPITKSDPTGLKACSDYFQCGYQIPTKKKKATPTPCGNYFSCGYSMPKHAQLTKYPKKRIQREMKELERQRRIDKRRADAEKARRDDLMRIPGGLIKGSPYLAGPPVFNKTWFTPSPPTVPDKVQHRGILDIIELLVNAAGTSGVNDGYEGFLTGAEKVNARNSGKAAGRLALFLGVTGVISDIAGYNDENNARGYRGWDANWRTGSNVVISFAATLSFTAFGVWSGGNVPGTPHMKVVGALYGGFLGSVAGYEVGEQAIARTRTWGW
jgi:RHS repeat-associated protein